MLLLKVLIAFRSTFYSEATPAKRSQASGYKEFTEAFVCLWRLNFREA
ncbi:MAG: hypothetical protein LBG47_01585 [Prevotellaceae bacterium]|nr:hypothetical protein [Prevotellaceae bacterium]